MNSGFIGSIMIGRQNHCKGKPGAIVSLPTLPLGRWTRFSLSVC